MKEDRRELPTRRAEDGIMSEDIKTATELTQKFAEDMNNRLARMERLLISRWLFVIAGFVISAVIAGASISRADSAANDAKAIASQNQQLITKIGQLTANTEFLRNQATLQGCRDQNNKNKNTIKELKKISEKEIAAGLLTSQRAKISITETTLLINSLDPARKGCVAYAERIAPLPPPTIPASKPKTKS